MVAAIWAHRGLARPTNDEAARLLAVLEEHPEYHSVWDRAAELDGEVSVGDADPFVHAQMHLIVENQLAEDDPREAGRAIRRLQKSGIDRHEAIHKVAYVLLLLMRPVLTEGVEFDNVEYRRRLRQLR